MTNTLPARKPRAVSARSFPGSAVLSRENGTSLVEQIVRLIQTRIDDKLLRSGARMPSIRQFADSHAVSRFTVVEAYDRLVAQGYLESRRGSGFYVRERAPLALAAAAPTDSRPPQLDVVWLVRNMFREHPPQRMPGS
ncbi:MAG TPA: winged helix-turn-helix domain-containing protein, partial [Noviherbaspirillum sp.]